MQIVCSCTFEKTAIVLNMIDKQQCAASGSLEEKLSFTHKNNLPNKALVREENLLESLRHLSVRSACILPTHESLKPRTISNALIHLLVILISNYWQTNINKRIKPTFAMILSLLDILTGKKWIFGIFSFTNDMSRNLKPRKPTLKLFKYCCWKTKNSA